jgi:uncharacterized protein YsxB (DUF464 family)
MITATYHRTYNRLTVTGHAHSGESGHDLVCASASALVLTLAANVASLTPSGSASKHVVFVKEGDAEISCVPNHKMRSVVTLIFDTVCSGFEVLQNLYPENITYQILG